MISGVFGVVDACPAARKVSLRPTRGTWYPRSCVSCALLPAWAALSRESGSLPGFLGVAPFSSAASNHEVTVVAPPHLCA